MPRRKKANEGVVGGVSSLIISPPSPHTHNHAAHAKIETAFTDLQTLLKKGETKDAFNKIKALLNALPETLRPKHQDGEALSYADLFKPLLDERALLAQSFK